MSQNTMRCPNCGHGNEASDHFCSNCGTRLLKSTPPVAPEPETPTNEPVATEPAAPPPPRSSFPPPVTPSFVQNPPPPSSGDDGEWRMSSLGPPPKPKRRIWLWIVIGILATCLVICVATAIFLNTGTGQDWLNDIGTEVANEATKQAQ